ncbi:hypothetical protein V8C26DRAFT_215382 [Trichoderma gracile]
MASQTRLVSCAPVLLIAGGQLLECVFVLVRLPAISSHREAVADETWNCTGRFLGSSPQSLLHSAPSCYLEHLQQRWSAAQPPSRLVTAQWMEVTTRAVASSRLSLWQWSLEPADHAAAAPRFQPGRQ